jgi:hypothetical protein
MDDDIAFNMPEISDPGSAQLSVGRRLPIIGKKRVNHIQPPGKLCFLCLKETTLSNKYRTQRFDDACWAAIRSRRLILKGMAGH